MPGTFRSNEDGSHYPVGTRGIDREMMSDLARQDAGRAEPENKWDKELRLTRERQKKSGLTSENAIECLSKIANEHTYDWQKFRTREGDNVQFQIKPNTSQPVWYVFIPSRMDRTRVNRMIRDGKKTGFLYRGVDHYTGSFGVAQADYKAIEFALPSLFDKDYPPK